MKVEQFRDELKGIDVSEYRWKENMMMAVNLYKAMGYKLKDVKDDSALKTVFLYVSELVENITHPDIMDFYNYISTKEECSDVKSLRDKLTDDRIKDLVFQAHHNARKNKKENKNDFVEDLYQKIGAMIAGRLIKNTSFLNEFMKQNNVDDVKEKLMQNGDELWEELYAFYLKTPKYKEYIKDSFIKEMQDSAKEAEAIIRKGLLNRILTITNFFKDTGYLEEIADTNNSKMNKMGILPMQVSLTDTKGMFNVMNLTNPEYFKQFNNEELFFLAAYYTNRFEKKVEEISTGVYLHERLGTFYDMVECGDTSRKVTADDAKVVLKQKEFLDRIAGVKFKELKDNVNDDTKIDDIDISIVPKEYIDKYGEAYQKYFNMYIPKSNNENDFEKDYQFVFFNQSILYCIYALKDFSIESLLYTLSQNKSKFNFGLIKEDRKTVNRYGEEQVAIGVDYKEFPSIRLHFPKEDFETFLRTSYQEDFRSYIGNDDFNINGTEMRTHLLYKFTKDQKQGIKKLYESLDESIPKYKFVRHMYENIHPSQNPLNTKKKERKLVKKKSSDPSDDFGDK